MTLSLIPESAPFTPEQRAWLNGFFAGYLGIDVQSDLQNAAAAPAVTAAEEQDFPWHDDTLPITRRMALAAGRPYRFKLMAALGQQDCGQCGYLCKTYAQAIADGTEQDLTLCVPGSRETRKMLKTLVAEAPAADRAGPRRQSAAAAGSARSHPCSANIIAIKPLHQGDSIKETYHVAIDITGGNINYHPGDALGIFPHNCPQLVDAVLEIGNSKGDETLVLEGRTLGLREALVQELDITRPGDEAVAYLAAHAGDAGEAEALAALAQIGVEEGRDLLDLLEEFPTARPAIRELAARLGKLQPRLYSIASSPNMHPGEVHLTVGTVRYRRKKRLRKGVASAHFADTLKAGDAIRVYVQPGHNFRLPDNGDTPIIMIGPGTGIAPFIAFLQERLMLGHRGRTWLFFGNPNGRTDFFYEQELKGYRREGLLTRLDTAFSRDQPDKIYVQHRMLQHSRELWKWIHEDGAAVYVCGDAGKMAHDVDDVLRRIAVQTHHLTEEQAQEYFRQLAKERRYLRDVY